jgi:hypothetical protein
MDLDDRCVDHGVFHVRLLRAGFEKSKEDIGFNPVAVSLENRVPLAEERRKVAPRAARPNDPENRFDKPTIVAPASPRVRGLS